MQLGIRLHDTRELPFEERIADVHRLGFACGHLALAKVIREFPTTDEALTPGLAMYIRNVFAKNNVDIAVVSSDKLVITDVLSALDFIMTVKYETDCTNIALNKEAVIDDY